MTGAVRIDWLNRGAEDISTPVRFSAGLSASDERPGTALGLEGGKETLFHSIVIAIAAPAHADSDQMLGEQFAVIVAGILAAARRQNL